MVTDEVNRIVGRWRSPPQGLQSGEWGPSQMVMELRPSGQIKVTITVSEDSPGGSGVQSNEGTYHLTDDALTTDVMARGEPIKFGWKGDHLILTLPKEADKPPEVYEFARDGVEKAAERTSGDEKESRK